MSMNDADVQTVVERYTRRFVEFGYDPRTLGWDKGKQMLRFGVLTSQIELRGKRILDIGCGFGDLNKLLCERCGDEYRYLGVDLVPNLIEQGRERFGGPGVEFLCGDFLAMELDGEFDYAVASGMFNFKLANADNYKFIQAVMTKAFAVCCEGFAFDFLSDKVDFQHEHTFHSSPAHILSLAYNLSRNVVLRNDCMPFEFAIFVNKDASFDKSDTIFHYYKQQLTHIQQHL